MNRYYEEYEERIRTADKSERPAILEEASRDEHITKFDMYWLGSTAYFLLNTESTENIFKLLDKLDHHKQPT